METRLETAGKEAAPEVFRPARVQKAHEDETVQWHAGAGLDLANRVRAPAAQSGKR